MAKDKGKNGGKRDKDRVTPHKKDNRLIWWLLAALLVSAGAALFLINPGARAKAAALPAKFKAAAGAFKEGSRQPEGAAMGGADATLKIQNGLVAKFTELEMRDSDYSIQYYPKDSTIEIKAAVPRGRPTEWIIWELANTAKNTPYSVDDCFCAPPAQTNCTIIFKSANAKHPKITLNVKQSGRYFSNTAKMAILIEDFGFEANRTTAEYLSFPEPLTVSLVPAQKLTAWTAQIADEYKKEVVLSLPMEPLPQQFDKYRQSMVKIHQSGESIRDMISQAAAAVPNFSGITNFHGARVMEDTRVMEIILAETNKRKAYFVYTDASRKSVVPKLVKDMKIPSHPIQGTISADLTPEQTRERLRRFAMTAEKTGKVLIKAPPSPIFIQVLKEEAETLKKSGIRLVYVSEVM